MDDFKTLYHLLFNAVTDAIEAQKKGCHGRAMLILIHAQQKAEDFLLQKIEDAENTPQEPPDCAGYPNVLAGATEFCK